MVTVGFKRKEEKFVCVYGTLKEDYGNNRLLEGSRKVAEGLLEGHRLFYSSGTMGFPVAKPDPSVRASCEVYEVDEATVERLDRLEGYSKRDDRGMYLRRTAKVICKDGEVRECMYYLGSDDFWDFNRMTPCPINNNVSTWSGSKWN